MRTGTARLPLHGGRAPAWLFKKMVLLSGVISEAIINEYGTKNFLKRISDPYWFQSLSCVIGFDWHSSGTTTTTTGAIKEALKKKNIGLEVAGGKGRTALKTTEEISNSRILSSNKIKEMIYNSRITAKIDNALVQDDYKLYHHAFFYDEKGNWSVIQQGMNNNNKFARRYHWYSGSINNIIEEPHSGIISNNHNNKVLDMTSRNNKEIRKQSIDIINDSTLLRNNTQKQITDFIKENKQVINNEKELVMPSNHYIKNMNKKQLETLRKAREIRPRDYEELISIKGLGPSLIRSLALTANIIYGTPISWKDPAKYSFAHGGKDGIPYPVDKKTMTKTTSIIRQAIEESKINNNDKIRALKKLSMIAEKF